MAAPWLTFHPSPLRSPHEGLTGYLRCSSPSSTSFFLRSPLRLVVAPLCLAIITLVLITQATPAQLVQRTTYRDFNFPPVRATMTAPFPNPLIWRPSIKDPLGAPTLWFLILRRFRRIRFYYPPFLWSYLPISTWRQCGNQICYDISRDMSNNFKWTSS